MIERHMTPILQKLVNQYPVVAVTGPRQSGKTTLVQAALPEHDYVSLEEPDKRRFASEDPHLFLDAHGPSTIIDEIQRVPELLSYIQGRVDREKRPGQYVLTGSSNLLLLEGVSQTLAGRVSLLTLLPLSLGELERGKRTARDLEGILFSGLYPRIHDQLLEPERWYASYVETYLERDVRRIINVAQLGRFQLFLRLCAARSGQLVNLTSLGNDCGITHNTARSWLSVLEASYVVRLVRPFHANFCKRLVKAQKLYFLDPGLVCYLLEIDTERELLVHSARGPLFETWVHSEFLKARVHVGLPPRLHFWRDYAGHEVDFVLGPAHSPIPVEVKSGRTITTDSFKGLRYWSRLAGESGGRGWVVYGGDDSHSRSDGEVLSWRDLSRLHGPRTGQ